MTKAKSTKAALISSALALFLCFAMLLGTTFAWFTDSVTSTGNIIQSGNLDIEMYWANGIEDPDAAAWTDASTGAIFNYDNWEPGYVEVYHIKVENKGSLALKYQFSIVANGEVSDLSDVIDVYYADPAVQIADRTGLTADMKLGTLTEVLDAISTTASGSLESEESHIVTIALKMQETAGNDYQNKSIGTDFSIVLTATQDNSEEDAFGSDYDAGLTPPDEEGNIFTEVDGIQYYYTEEGEHVLYYVPEEYAEATVVVPEGVTTIGNYAFAYNSNVKEVILSSTVRSLGRGFDSSTVEKVVLNEGLEQIDSRAFRSTTNLQEVVISSTVKTIADNAFQKSGIKEIVIPATVETIGEAAFGSSKIESVTFEGNTSIQGYAFRGCANLRTVTLKGDDVTFIASTLNGRNSMWFCNGESNNPNTSNITFYVVNETVLARVKAAMGAEANNTDVYMIPDTAWYNDTTATEYTLNTPAELAGLAEIVNSGADFTATVKLGGDIDFEGIAWTPIGAGDEAFCGTFDGCGYTINGLTADVDSGIVAFFGTLDEATVKNVNFTNVNIKSSSAGVVAGYAGGATIENVHVLSGTLTGKSYAGAFAAVQAYYGTSIINCTNYATVKSNSIAGGFGGYIWYGCVLENCTNYGDVTGGDRAGGIASYVGGTATNCTNNGDVVSNGAMPAGGIAAIVPESSTFEGCINNGDVTNNGTSAYNSLAGGIVGQSSTDKPSTIKNCTNTGNIKAANGDAAGIAVSHYGSLTVTDCVNTGDVYGKNGAEGIVAANGMFGGSNTQTNCTNSGTVTEG